MTCSSRSFYRALLPVAVCCLAAAVLGCGRKGQSPRPQGGNVSVQWPAGAKIDLPKGPDQPGTAVAILLDTSPSMQGEVPGADGKRRPKTAIARDALGRIIDQLARWKKDNPDKHLQLGILNFSSSVGTVLPMGEFDEGKARAALGRIPAPTGGTAIGRALEEGAKAVYRTGCPRRFLVCITDGENTSGPLPDGVARQLHQQTNGGVSFNFVAFDTKASQFSFLNQVNGHVVEASDGNQLQTELARIYEKRILAEAPAEPSPK